MDNCGTKTRNHLGTTLCKVYNVEVPEGWDCPENILAPRIQTKYWLMKGVKFAYTNRKERIWNKIECREYLETMEIAEKYQKIWNQTLEWNMKFKPQSPCEIFVSLSLANQLSAKRLYHCTYASAGTLSAIKYYFGIAQVLNIKEQSKRI